MAKLIDADALIENIVETAKDLRTLSTKTIGEAIHKTPTVDAVPVRHGKWIHKWSGCGSVWLEQRCSECGVTFEEEPIDYNYCPNCGADMREEE